ncbi:MAG TPA: 50S ribosomal protein L21 [Oligoflexia bacterium]|nr:50S ribosomal protein L21 [Oligoflexia bacterium]HMP27898.1 50S ribosomal protein L21 [Oligoflexia bacterium]
MDNEKKDDSTKAREKNKKKERNSSKSDTLFGDLPSAIFELGGKQFIGSVGCLLEVDTIEPLGSAPTEKSSHKIKSDKVLFISSGGQTAVGAPYIANASVECSLVSSRKGPKLLTYKKIRRGGYTKKIGHRQPVAIIKVDQINF